MMEEVSYRDTPSRKGLNVPLPIPPEKYLVHLLLSEGGLINEND